MMIKKSGKKRYEAKSGPFDPSKKFQRAVPEKTDRNSDGFRGRKEKSSEHFIPSGRTRDLPEKTDRSRGDSWTPREGKPFPSFDRPKRESGFVSSSRPLPQEQPKTVSAAALKRGLERAKVEITGVCDEISILMTSRYNIGEVELTASFNAGGEFIGFGAGGVASIKIKIIPSKK